MLHFKYTVKPYSWQKPLGLKQQIYKFACYLFDAAEFIIKYANATNKPGERSDILEDRILIQESRYVTDFLSKVR